MLNRPRQIPGRTVPSTVLVTLDLSDNPGFNQADGVKVETETIYAPLPRVAEDPATTTTITDCQIRHTWNFSGYHSTGEDGHAVIELDVFLTCQLLSGHSGQSNRLHMDDAYFLATAETNQPFFLTFRQRPGTPLQLPRVPNQEAPDVGNARSISFDVYSWKLDGEDKRAPNITFHWMAVGAIREIITL